MFGLLLVVLSKAYMVGTSASLEKEAFRERNLGYGDRCSQIGPLKTTACQNDESPQYLVWGDSMAMQLVDGLVTSRNPPPGVLQATRHNCAPLIGVSSAGDLGDLEFKWAKTCLDFNEEVISTLEGLHTIKTVVLSGNLIYLLKPNQVIVYRNSDGTLTSVNSDPKLIFKAIERTVSSLHNLGLRVVFVLPPPSATYDVGRCIARRLNSMPIWGEEDDCLIDKAEFFTRRSERLDPFIATVREKLGIGFLSFEDILCDSGMCMTMIDGTPLYRDGVHFAIEGGRKIIHLARLLDQIDRLAK